MKKFQLILILVILIFIAIVGIQNRVFFLSAESLNLNLGFFKYQSPEIRMVLFFAISFFAGLFIAFLFGLLARFKAHKTIKNLNKTVKSQIEKISSLEKEASVPQTEQKDIT